MNNDVSFESLIGKVLVSITNNDNSELIFKADDGEEYISGLLRGCTH